MDLSLFVNSLLEFSLSFGSEYLCDNLSIISILVLSLFVYFFIYSVGIPSTHRANFRKHEHTQKRHCRAKRRRKGGTREVGRYSPSGDRALRGEAPGKTEPEILLRFPALLSLGVRHHHCKKDERELIDFMKSPLGQNYDITRCRQLLCPDPSRKVCNNATTEINQLFSKAMEVSTPSLSLVASTAPVKAPLTEPPSSQSYAFTGASPGELIPTPLPEPSPPPPSELPLKAMTTLGNFLSPSPPGETRSPEPVHHSSSRPKDLFSSTLTQYEFHQGFLALRSTKISFGADSEAKFIDSRHLLFLSPDEQDSAQNYLNPKIWEDRLKQKFAQLFWGLPSLHSESLSSAVHVSGDYQIFFNSISTNFSGQKSTGIPYFLPPSLPEVQPQPLPQTLPQSQDLHLPQNQPQAHLQSPLPILPSSPITQDKVCEVSFHKPKNESQCLTSSEMEHQECNVLQKEQGSLCGLTSVEQSSKAHVAISIDPVEFPLSREFREKFESHLRVRLIQHHKGQPWKTQGSLSGMGPPKNCSGILQSKSSSGLSWAPIDKDQISENPNVGLSQPGSSYDRSSEMFQLEENEGKDEVHSQDNDPKVHLLSDSKTSSHKDVASGSDMSLSRQKSVLSGLSLTQRQLENIQRVYVSRKVEKMLLGTVHSSQHSINEISSIESHTKLEQRSLPSSVGGLYHLDTSQELPLVECAAEQIQKPHIPKFQMGRSGLPTKVLESKEHFKFKGTSSYSSINPNSSSSIKLIYEANTKSGASKDTQSYSFINPDLSSSAKLFSKVNPKLGTFMPLRESSESLLGAQMGRENAADHLNIPVPATSLVGKKEHKPTDIQRILSEEIQKILKAKLPVANTTSGRKSKGNSMVANIQPPKVPTRQAGTPQTTTTSSVTSNDKAEIQQGEDREESEPAFISSVPREIVGAQGLSALQPKTSGAMTTSEPGPSQRINKETTAVVFQNPPSNSLIPAPDLADLATQLMSELKLKFEKRCSQAPGQPTDVSFDSDSWNYKASLTLAKGGPSVVMQAPQVMRVHSEQGGVRMEQPQEPWLPKHLLRSCRDQNVPPDVKKDIVHPPPKPTDPSDKDLGAGDARVTISQPGGKRFHPQDTAVEEMFGSDSLKEEALSDSLFINKIKRFFRRLQPTINYQMQEVPQEEGSPMCSAQNRGPGKSTVASTENMQDQRVISDMGKCPEEKLGRQRIGATTCPQEPLPPASQSGTPVQKGAAQAQAEPGQGQPFHRTTPSYAMSGRHAAILAGQGSTCNTHTRKEDKHPQNVMALKPQQMCQKDPQSVSLKGTVPHPSPSCRPRVAKGPPAVPATAESTERRHPPPRFRHTMLLQNFQRDTFAAPK